MVPDCMRRFTLAACLMLATTACGPSSREQELEASFQESQAKVRELEEKEGELRELLERAQASIANANSEINSVQIAALGECENLRFAASMLYDIDEIDIP